MREHKKRSACGVFSLEKTDLHALEATNALEICMGSEEEEELEW